LAHASKRRSPFCSYANLETFNTKERKTMNAMTKTAEEIAAAIKTSGVSLAAIVAAIAKSAPKGEGTNLISTQAQAEKAGPGVYRVEKAEGLYLKKGAGGSGNWFRRYWSHGKRREMGFGALARVSLAEVRKLASQFDVDRNAGHDPIELRRAAKIAAVKTARAAAAASDKWTFVQATESYLKAHAPSWKHSRALSVWVNPIVRYAYPVIGEMTLDEIEVAHVDAIMTATVKGGAPAVAPRIRLRIEQVLNAASALGKRNAKLPNPASVKLINAVRPVKKAKKSVEHFRRISIDAAPATFRKLMTLAANSTPISAVMFMILTATRPSEALNASWGEIDLAAENGPVWKIPKEHMKAAVEHIVPLSSAAVAILERQQAVRTGDAVFPGRSGSPAAYSVFAKAPIKAGIDIGALHAWRSIFSDVTAEKLGVDRETREFCLAHGLDPVEGAYRRGTSIDKRRTALQRYADWLSGEGANVVAFPARA
jgi:integrase